MFIVHINMAFLHNIQHLYIMLISFCSAVEDDKVKIVAVDLQQMAPLPGVTQIQGDITKVFIYLSIISQPVITFIGINCSRDYSSFQRITS